MQQNKKVAIIFYGLSRYLDKTINSLHTHLFNVLQQNNIDYDIFIHTYKIYGPYTNIWRKYSTDNYINEDVEQILNPKYSLYDNQNDIINQINFEEYYTKLGNWTGMTEEMTKYLIKNMCLALYSKKSIVSLFEKYKDNYDYGIIIRPDMELTTDIDIAWLSELNNNNIIIPSKDWFYGCNDRLCIGTKDIILYYGKLFDNLKEYSQSTSIISEKYLLDMLTYKNIKIISKNIQYIQR